MQFQSDIDKGVVQSPIYDFSESKPLIRYNNLELPKEYNYPSFQVPLILITYQIGIYTMQLSNRRLIDWKVSQGSQGSLENIAMISLMPLINEKVSTLKAQYNCMEIIKNTKNVINSGHIPIDVSDQPVYALSKEVQLRYPLCLVQLNMYAC